jgi:anhydro-N-acetylmuramic acid kinase
MTNSNLKKQTHYTVIGVMSGTSLDGVDLCLSSFQFDTSWKFQITATQTVKYSEEWQQRLRAAIHLDSNEIESLNEEYTRLLAEFIQPFIEAHSPTTIDAICSHGHTIFHQPSLGKTLQIGNLPVLATYLNQTVVCDFRTQDVALGGQGAPLVPIGDALLFSEYDYCLNLGGFANISFEHHNKRMAFDICPVNIVLNHYVSTIGMAYDSEGQIAAKGRVCKPLLKKLNELKFYTLEPPKSLGLEWVQSGIFPLIQTYELEVPSVLRTLVEHCAIQLSNILNQNHLRKGLITGGGVFNSFLMQRFSELTKCDLHPANPTIIEFKEALIFGFLGILKLRNDPNCLQSVTGAKHDHSSGAIYFPEIKQ